MAGGWRDYIKVSATGILAAATIRLLFATLRWEKGPQEHSDQVVRSQGQTIWAFWHGRMLGLPGHYRARRKAVGRELFVLISRHSDGRIIARAMRSFRVGSVAGSSSRGALGAFLALVRKADEGADLAITPDGPRGPRYECKPGVAALAQKTQLPIVPVTFSARSRWQLGSWDGMIVPKPFSHAILFLGEPLVVGADEDVEAARLRIEAALNALTQRADDYWTGA